MKKSTDPEWCSERDRNQSEIRVERENQMLTPLIADDDLHDQSRSTVGEIQRYVRNVIDKIYRYTKAIEASQHYHLIRPIIRYTLPLTACINP